MIEARKEEQEGNMSDNVFSQIQSTAARINDMKKVLAAAADSLQGARWWANTGLAPLLGDIIAALSKAEQELSRPCLKIAFVGTTSSGKSTLLNGLAGHRIAPMEAGEMSAGVVRIRNGDQMSLTVRETENMTWQAGPYQVRNDEDIYGALRDAETGIMTRYWKAAEKNAGVMAPEIEITAQLAPKYGGIPQFQMPDFIDLEFYDLPGLKTVTDSRNLEVIQRHLAGSFLLIVLNYSDTDSEKRKTLLQEIKKIVWSICRNKEALIFVLNRVDERNSEDDPLQDRIASLRKNIQEVLELPELPPVIPMSALPLYLVQTAWGAEKEPIYQKGFVDKSRNQLRKFFGDCAKIIEILKDESEEKDGWFTAHNKRNIDKEGAWDADDVPQLLHWIYEYSGAYEFWKTLQKKLDEQIGAIIINPALGELPALLDDFSAKFKDLVHVLGLSTKEEIRKEQEAVKALGEEIKKNLQDSKDKFIGDFKESIEACKNLESRRIKHEEFKKMGTIVKEIADDIHDTIMVPLRDALVSDDAAQIDELEITLEKAVPKELARKITCMAKQLLIKGYGEYAKTGKKFQCRADQKEQHSPEIEKLQALDKRRLDLAGYVDKALLGRSKLLLQERLIFFEDAAQGIIQRSMQVLASQFQNRMQGADVHSMFVPLNMKRHQINLSGDVFSKITIANAEEILRKTVTERY
jgi:GTPase SAR1 family protein